LLWSSSHFGANFVLDVLFGESAESIESSLDSTPPDKKEFSLWKTPVNLVSPQSQSQSQSIVPWHKIRKGLGLGSGPTRFKKLYWARSQS
jgi:hypothetical protein